MGGPFREKTQISSEITCDDKSGALGAPEIQETLENETITEAAQSKKLWKRWFNK